MSLCCGMSFAGTYDDGITAPPFTIAYTVVTGIDPVTHDATIATVAVARTADIDAIRYNYLQTVMATYNPTPCTVDYNDAPVTPADKIPISI